MLKRKRLGVITATILALSVILSGCSTTKNVAANKVSSINLYAGGSDNVRTTWEALIKAFNEKNSDVKVNLQFIPSGTGAQSAIEKLIAAEKAGQKETDMDIVDVSDSDIVRLFKEAGKESIISLSEKEVPNIKDIKYKSPSSEDRALVFRGTTVVFAYNSDKVKQMPKTDKELYEWIKANPGRFAYNDPTTGGAGSSFVVTSVYNKLPKEAITSDDVKWKAQWEEGFKLLKELHPYMYKASGKVQYPAKNQGTLDLLANGQVDIIPAWADMTLEQLSKGTLPKSIKIAQITPELTGNLQSLVVPTKGKNKEAAQKFLNFTVSAQGQDIFLNTMKAIPVIDASKLSKESLALLSGLEIKAFRGYSIGNLGTELNKRWQDDIATLK
jgi:putative spermidine/putrescine transport system substrate-binding protein